MKRNATFGAGPWPRKIPWPRSGRHAAGLPPASAFSAFSIFSASSCGLPKSIATRSGARRSASLGGAAAYAGHPPGNMMPQPVQPADAMPPVSGPAGATAPVPNQQSATPL